MADGRRRFAPDTALVAPNARHQGDLARVVAGLVVLTVTALAVYRDRLSAFEANLFFLVNDLPAAIAPYLDVVMQAGNGVAGPVLAMGVLAIGGRRRWRPAFDLAVVGVVAWIAAKVVKDIVQRPRPGGLLEEVARFGSDEGLGFVSGHAAVAAALAAAAAPYLGRTLRRVVWIVPWIVGFARVYFGAHLPLDIVGGVALGWFISAGLHFALGAPHGRPTPADATEMLQRAGWQPRRVESYPGIHQGSFPFVASTDSGSIFVKLLDPDTRDRDLIVRVARILAFRDVRDEASVLDAPAQANREASFSLLARQQGVSVPMVRAIVRHGDQVWLVSDHVPSTDLRAVRADRVTDELLHELWGQLGAMRAAGIAHRDLVASNILIDDDGSPWLVDFAHAESFPRPHVFDNDVAELLVSTSLLVGPERAAAAAVASLGSGPVGRSLPELAPLALTPEARRRVHGSDHLQRLRQAVVERTTAVPPRGSSTARPGWRDAIAIAVLVATVTVLVTIAGGADVGDALLDARPRWLGIAAVSMSVAALAGGASLVASIERRVAIGRAVAFRVAAHGAALAAGRRGERSAITGQFARTGVLAADAVAALRRTRVAGLAAWAAVAGVALIEAIDDEHGLVRPAHLAVLVAVAIAAAVSHLALTVLGRAPRHVPAEERPARADRLTALEFSWFPVVVARLVEVAAGTLGVIALVTAFDTDVPASHVAVIHLVGWAVVNLVPITPLTAARPAILAIGLATSTAALPAAVAVAGIVAVADLARSAVGLAVPSRRTTSSAADASAGGAGT